MYGTLSAKMPRSEEKPRHEDGAKVKRLEIQELLIEPLSSVARRPKSRMGAIPE
jgi:hypothetical protein